jgi:hypothetical protein
MSARIKRQRNDWSEKDEKFKFFGQKIEVDKHGRRWEDTFKKGDGST